MPSDSEKNLKRIALNAWEPEQRADAARQIHDQQFLTKLVLTDLSSKVRDAAIENIIDPDYLTIIATRSKFPSIRTAAISKISDENKLVEIILESDFPTSVREAFEKLNSDESLATIAKQVGGTLGKQSLARISKRFDILKDIAIRSRDPKIQWMAVELLQSHFPEKNIQDLYFNMAKDQTFPIEIRLDALNQLNDKQFLFQLAIALSDVLVETESSGLAEMSPKIEIESIFETTLMKLDDPVHLQLISIIHPRLVPLVMKTIQQKETLLKISNDMPNLIDLVVHELVNRFGEFKDAMAIYQTANQEMRHAILQKHLKSDFLINLFDVETDSGLTLKILESIGNEEKRKRVIKNFPLQKLEMLATTLEKENPLFSSIQNEIAKKSQISFQTPEEAFNYVVANPNSPVSLDALELMVGTPFLEKILDQTVPFVLKQKVIDLMDEMTLQIVLLTVSDIRIQDEIRQKLQRKA